MDAGIEYQLVFVEWPRRLPHLQRCSPGAAPLPRSDGREWAVELGAYDPEVEQVADPAELRANAMLSGIFQHARLILLIGRADSIKDVETASARIAHCIRWLAGLPSDLAARAPADVTTATDGAPLFVCASRLIAPKGIDLLIEAVAIHRRETGPCTVWIMGDGPEREHLTELACRLGVEDSVVFLGTVDPGTLKGALELCDALVFPTLQDLLGRVVVEALTVGTPVVLSPMTGAAGTVVRDGVNGLIVDPRDPRELARALARFAEPQTRLALRDGACRSSAMLAPDAVAALILRSVALVRDRRRTDAGSAA